MALIRTLRPLNLLIIVLTMLLLEYFLLAPILRTLPFHQGEELFSTPRSHFFLLILSTVLIAAAGNIINDYFDIRADRINKPEKVIIGKKLERRTAMLVHFLFNSLAILIAAYISWWSGVWSILLLQLFAAGVLWFYSLFLKHQPFLGNVLIALITAAIPLLILLYELPPLIRSYREELFQPVYDAIALGKKPSDQLFVIVYWLLGYAGFAFLTTLIREVQKDLADQEGDRKAGSRTLPIAFGERRTKKLAGSFFLLFFLALGISWTVFLRDPYSLAYLIIGVMAPALVSASLMFSKGGRERYLQASNWMKLTMLMGVLFTIFVTQFAPEGLYLP